MLNKGVLLTGNTQDSQRLTKLVDLYSTKISSTEPSVSVAADFDLNLAAKDFVSIMLALQIDKQEMCDNLITIYDHLVKHNAGKIN